MEKAVKNICVDLKYMPKLGLAKKRIDRNAIIDGVKAGNRYVIPFTVTFSDSTSWTSKFFIIKMFKEDNKKDIVIVEEEMLGQFGVTFNNLMHGTFKGEMQNAYDRMIKLKNTYAKDLENAEKKIIQEREQVELQKKQKTKAEVEAAKTRTENLVLQGEKQRMEMELDEVKYQLATVNARVESVQSSLPKTIKKAVKLASKGFSEMEIMAMLEKLGLL